MDDRDGEVVCIQCGTKLNRTDMLCWRCGSRRLEVVGGALLALRSIDEGDTKGELLATFYGGGKFWVSCTHSPRRCHYCNGMCCGTTGNSGFPNPGGSYDPNDNRTRCLKCWRIARPGQLIDWKCSANPTFFD